MDRKKALLMLFGGRLMPNMLTIIHEKPDIIVPIISQDMQTGLSQLQDAIQKLFAETNHKYELNISYVVNAFDLTDITTKCMQAVATYSNSDWIFNITSATTIMSIGAYEAAKLLVSMGESISCWYFDTAHTNVVSLTGRSRDASIFHIEVNQYATVYNCRLVPGILEEQRNYCQEYWLPFTQKLVENPHYIDLLKKITNNITHHKPAKDARSASYIISPTSDDTYTLLEEGYKTGLLSDLTRDKSGYSFKLSYLQANFLEGSWLELYVWEEARKLNLFSDCQWNQKIIDNKKVTDKDSKNELDVSMLYNAQLFIAECKTGENDSFAIPTLYKLDSVANSLGGRFVGRLLVTSLPIPNEKDHNKRKQFEEFKERAEERGIVLVTRETLPDIRKILETQAKNPKHARI